VLGDEQRIVALLPMKANSERVRGKNFREFNGKPLFRWILDTLLSVEEIDRFSLTRMRGASWPSTALSTRTGC
jgi:CMP-N-acetylneuraminic acid synthetase